jgi:hypothetical protein
MRKVKYLIVRFGISLAKSYSHDGGFQRKKNSSLKHILKGWKIVIMPKKGYMWMSMLVWFAISSTGQAQVALLEGAWEIQFTGVENAMYGPVTIDGNGNMSFLEILTYDYEGMAYVFDIEHRGKITYNAEHEFVYLGVGNGVARDTNGAVTVRLDVIANGIGDANNNVVVGGWYNKETYVTPIGVLYDEDGWSFAMTREGYDPGAPGEAVAGVWEITLTSENFSWTGEVTLAADGTMMGEYSSTLSEAAALFGGFYSYSEDKTFAFSYSTMTVLPVVGETTFTVAGEGQGNEENTQITGTWSLTVDITNRLTQTFTGTFELKKIETSGVDGWNVYQ